jgi:hypothetical protein
VRGISVVEGNIHNNYKGLWWNWSRLQMEKVCQSAAAGNRNGVTEIVQF